MQNVDVGQDIRPVGSDIREGEVVLGCGALMGPGEVRANIANICQYCWQVIHHHQYQKAPCLICSSALASIRSVSLPLSELLRFKLRLHRALPSSALVVSRPFRRSLFVMLISNVLEHWWWRMSMENNNIMLLKVMSSKNLERSWRRGTSGTATRPPWSRCSSRRALRRRTLGWRRTTSRAWRRRWSPRWRSATCSSPPAACPWGTGTCWDRLRLSNVHWQDENLCNATRCWSTSLERRSTLPGWRWSLESRPLLPLYISTARRGWFLVCLATLWVFWQLDNNSRWGKTTTKLLVPLGVRHSNLPSLRFTSP